MRLVAHELGADGRKVGERRRRRRRDGEDGQQLKKHFDFVCLVTSQREIVYWRFLKRKREIYTRQIDLQKYKEDDGANFPVKCTWLMG